MGQGRGWSMLAMGLVVGAHLVACAGDDPKVTGVEDDGGADGADGTDGDDTLDPVAVGGFSISGQLVDASTGAPLAAGLCVTLSDPSTIPAGEPLLDLVHTTSTDGGGFVLADLDPATTLGLVLHAGACDGGDPVDTGVFLDVGTWAGLGPEDVLTIDLQVMSAAERDAIDEELLASGATVVLADVGGIVGAVIDPEWGAVEGAWVRGPDPADAWYAPWYDKGGGEWKSYDGTSVAGRARFAIPGAPWGAWLCRASETDFPVLVGGGLEGIVVMHDFLPWQ